MVARNRYNGGDDSRRNDWDDSVHDDAVSGDSAEYEAYDSAYVEAYDDGYDEYDDDGVSRALVAQRGGQDLAEYAPESTQTPVVIPGSGMSMGDPFIKRRERPLTMRLAVLMLVATLVVTGLISVTPIGAQAQPGVSSFEALAGAVVLTNAPQYFWYTAQWGDTTKSLAQKFHVTEGGILKMNSLCPSQDLQKGIQYKIPVDPNYGSTYQQDVQASGECNLLPTSGVWGQTVFGTNWWNARAGEPSGEALCSPNYGPNYMDFKFIAPNWNAYWVRGFSYFHDGIDLAAPQGNPIHAVQAGQIIWAGYDGTNGFGWSVVINHCNHVSSLYGHMRGLAPGIQIGQNVEQGQVIGYEGSTGWSTGPHLHLSVMVDNQMVNPMMFYPDVNHILHYLPNG